MAGCSVVVPVYKGNKYIPKLISMIRKWKEADANLSLELIFINDFPEETIVLPEWVGQSGISVKVFNNERNMGIHYSRIMGVRQATGDYVVFLDQDDTLSENYIVSQLQHMKDGEAVICNGLYRNGEKLYSPSNPMRDRHTFEGFLEYGYPLVSLGQLLIRRDRIPLEWLDPENVMVHNGWDDAYLWALMMVHQVKVNNNEEVLYIHEEDGRNASFNWKTMALSGKNFRDLFLRLNLLDEYQERRFRELVDRKILKYEMYAEMDALMNAVSARQLERRLLSRNMREIAVYGIGVYGKKLCEMLATTCIEVKYGIDKRHDVKQFSFPVVPLHPDLDKVDAIVVTPVSDYAEIAQNLKDVCSIAVISLLDLLREAQGTYNEIIGK